MVKVFPNNLCTQDKSCVELLPFLDYPTWNLQWSLTFEVSL
jgi:hypothetical protein